MMRSRCVKTVRRVRREGRKSRSRKKSNSGLQCSRQYDSREREEDDIPDEELVLREDDHESVRMQRIRYTTIGGLSSSVCREE